MQDPFAICKKFRLDLKAFLYEKMKDKIPRSR